MSKTYIVGLPVIVTLHDDGSATLAVDATEAAVAVRKDEWAGPEGEPYEVTRASSEAIDRAFHERRMTACISGWPPPDQRVLDLDLAEDEDPTLELAEGVEYLERGPGAPITLDEAIFLTRQRIEAADEDPTLELSDTGRYTFDLDGPDEEARCDVCGGPLGDAAAAHWDTPTGHVLVAWSCGPECADAVEARRDERGRL